MNAPIPREEDRFDRACQWFIDLREQPQSPQLVADWLAWCRADPRNRDAFERAREVWQVTAVGRDSNLATMDMKPNHPWRPSARRFRIFALAASVAIVVMAYSVARVGVPSDSSTIWTTRSGENRVETLADGSTVVLGANSKLSADFDAQARRLTLERGEAYFRVKQERGRPFVVKAGDMRVTAIGTAFNVRTAAERVVVAVAEGVVAIDPPQDNPLSEMSTANAVLRDRLRAVAGQEVTVDIRAQQVQVNRVEAATVASWQSGRLEFAREPLYAVIASVNRYSSRPIALGDPQLGDLRYTGTVFTDRVEDWLEALPRIFPVAVREGSAGINIVSSP